MELWNSLRGRAVKPSVALSLSPSDDFEDEFIDAEIDRVPEWQSSFEPISGYAFVIGYTDSQGRTTQRLITCQRKDQCGSETYIWAWCHSRGAVRQFRLSRIVEVFDAHSGEALRSPSEVFEAFEVDRRQSSKPGWGLSVRARADLLALLNVLVFVARCDRDYHPLERSALEDVICRFWLRSEAPGEPDCEAIVHQCDRLAPDAETFYVALHRCADKSKLWQLLRQSAREIVDADGRLAREEVYWGSRIDEFLTGVR